jgi:asparagine synthase (glutamine-hydrolysing)
MCGIAGLLGQSIDAGVLYDRVAAMQNKLRHRGPDGEGIYIDAAAGVGLAHTRLAILDLSAAGRQPMSTRDGRYTITFNGEIYNFAEVRSELEAHGATFRSSGDTEVILAAYCQWGEACPQRFVGMFAFAIWDSVERSCFLARGPMGIKPLYFWQRGDQFAFASEIRAVLAADLGPRRPSARGLRGYFLFGSVQEPDTLIDGVEMLPAGYTLTWHAGRTKLGRFAGFACGEDGNERRDPATIASSALEASVRRHFVSDVPVSIFLSGGLDSTALVALARRCGFDNLKTFSISFDEPEFNEGDVAGRTAAHFGTQHVDWRLTPKEAEPLISQFLAAIDQPSNDGFNTYCVSKLAHDHGAKVVLSGLGGDELFGGYRSFRAVPRLAALHERWSRRRRLREWAGAAAERFGRTNRWRRAGVFLRSNGGYAAAYWAMRGTFMPAEADRMTAYYLGAVRVGFGDEPFGLEPPLLPANADRVSYLEATRYMQNQLLRDSDVMSMACGLELRVPFVDKALFDAVTPISASQRLAAGKGLLLDAVPEIPPWVVGAAKRGFSFPFEQWLTADWGALLLETDRRTPVWAGNWYRRWSLFTLEHFFRVNQVCCGVDLGSA